VLIENEEGRSSLKSFLTRMERRQGDFKPEKIAPPTHERSWAWGGIPPDPEKDCQEAAVIRKRIHKVLTRGSLMESRHSFDLGYGPPRVRRRAGSQKYKSLLKQVSKKTSRHSLVLEGPC